MRGRCGQIGRSGEREARGRWEMCPETSAGAGGRMPEEEEGKENGNEFSADCTAGRDWLLAS